LEKIKDFFAKISVKLLARTIGLDDHPKTGKAVEQSLSEQLDNYRKNKLDFFVTV
jgi:hypothetical protein